MMIDQELLARHRRYDDPREGISEEFLQPVLGSAKTVAVLSRPTAAARPLGFVVCHSFALEQVHLGRLEVMTARALSAAGFPVLRFHGRGYGDGETDMRGVGLSSHLAEARDAVTRLGEQGGVREVGVVGVRFGGTVAALTADREGLPAAAIWEPITDGAQFMRDFIRTQVFFEIAGAKGVGDVSKVAGLRQQLREQGWADIKGFPLSRATYEEISGVDLENDVRGFRGAALVGGVTRSGGMPERLVRLVARLRELGADCAEEAVQDMFAAELGQYHYHPMDGPDGVQMKTDTQLDLARAVAEATATWAAKLAGEREALS
ncbi:MAG: hypothetical protein ACT4PO_05935 [Actinomycetota bacterium]